MKVLIIEDEKAMSDLIAIKFKVEGFEVEQAFSIAEAKQKMSTPGINAILSDYLLPDGNSVDFLAEVRGNAGTAQLPIVIMTNYVEDVNLEKAKSIGVAEVIVKYQVVPAQMVEKIKALVGGGGAPVAPQAAPPQAAPVAPAPVVEPAPQATSPAVDQTLPVPPQNVSNPPVNDQPEEVHGS